MHFHDCGAFIHCHHLSLSWFITPHFSFLLRKKCWSWQAGCLTCVDFFLNSIPDPVALHRLSFWAECLFGPGSSLILTEDIPKRFFFQSSIGMQMIFPDAAHEGGHLMKAMLGTWTIYICLLSKWCIWYTSRNLNVPNCTVYKHVCLFLFSQWHVTVCSRDVGIIGSGASAVAAFIVQSECRRQHWPMDGNGFSFAAWIHAKPSPKISKRNTHLGSLRCSPFHGWFGNLRSTPSFPPYQSHCTRSMLSHTHHHSRTEVLATNGFSRHRQLKIVLEMVEPVIGAGLTTAVETLRLRL